METDEEKKKNCIKNNNTITIEAVKHYYGEKWRVTRAQVQYLRDLNGVTINNTGGNNRIYKFLTKRQASEAIDAAKLGKEVIINVH